jgi:hypothetical protein
MIKGVHFDGKTFSPTPNQHTNKILMALVAGEDLGPRATKLPHFFLPKPAGNENFLGGPRKNM